MDKSNQYQMPDYYKQQDIPGWSGTINNMVRALLGGYDQRPPNPAAQAQQAAGGNVNPIAGATVPAMGMPGGTAVPFGAPDPMTQALMTSPPQQ